MTTRCGGWMIGSVLAILVTPNAAYCQETGGAEIVKKVLADWDSRRTALKGVRYRIKGVETYPKGSLTETAEPELAHPDLRTTFPKQDTTLSTSRVLSFDFRKRLIRKECKDFILDLRLGKFVTREWIQVFDGKNEKRIEPKEANTPPGVKRHKRQPEFIIRDVGADEVIIKSDYPVLFAHGCPLPYGKRVHLANLLTSRLSSDIFVYHQKGEFAGRTCVVLRTVPAVGRNGRFDEFWVDTERKSAVIRYQSFRDNIVDVAQTTTFAQTMGQWLPASWRQDMYWVTEGQRELQLSEVVSDVLVEIDPAFGEAEFTLNPAPGMTLENEKGKTFTVGEDGRTLLPHGARKSSGRWTFVFAVAFAGLAVLAAYCWRSWRRSRV